MMKNIFKFAESNGEKNESQETQVSNNSETAVETANSSILSKVKELAPAIGIVAAGACLFFGGRYFYKKRKKAAAVAAISNQPGDDNEEN